MCILIPWLASPLCIVPLENFEMSERKGIIFPQQFMGNVIPHPDHEGQIVGGPG